MILRGSAPAFALLLFLAACVRGNEDPSFQAVRDSLLSIVGDVEGVPLESLVPEQVVGDVEGPPGAAFGMVGTVQALSRQRVAVLDERLLNVALFGAGGEFLEIIGRSGQGPGEFMYPTALRPIDQNSFLVADQQSHRLTIFAEGTEGSWSVEQTISTPFGPLDICRFGEDWMVLGLMDGRLIHRISSNGTLEASFGEPYSAEELPDGPLRRSAQRNLSGGRIVCLEESDRVILAARHRPSITAFTGDGEPLWSQALPEYLPLNPVSITIAGSQGSRYQGADDAGTHHRTVSALALPKDRILVQLATLDLVHRLPGDREITSWLLSSRTGRILGRSATLPVLADVAYQQAYAFSNSPYPRWAVAPLGNALRQVDEY